MKCHLYVIELYEENKLMLIIDWQFNNGWVNELWLKMMILKRLLRGLEQL